MPELSLVVPCYNEEKSIHPFINEFLKIRDRLPSTEIIFVNDGSTDRTYEVIADLKNFYPDISFDVKQVILSRNFGHQMALLAGMKNADGNACVTIDVDQQDPLELIIEMVEKWHSGYNIVLGKRIDRSSDSFFKRTTAHIFYKFMGYLTATKGSSGFPEHVGDFRLIDRTVLNILVNIREIEPYWRGLVAWIGFKKTEVGYSRKERFTGETKYSFSKMLALAMTAVFSFSKKPLYLSSMLGILVSGASLLVLLSYLILKISNQGSFITGWMSIVSVITLLGGMQLFCLGIIGQYIGRIYEQVIQRPNVIIDRVEKL